MHSVWKPWQGQRQQLNAFLNLGTRKLHPWPKTRYWYGSLFTSVIMVLVRTEKTVLIRVEETRWHKDNYFPWDEASWSSQFRNWNHSVHALAEQESMAAWEHQGLLAWQRLSFCSGGKDTIQFNSVGRSNQDMNSLSRYIFLIGAFNRSLKVLSDI